MSASPLVRHPYSRPLDAGALDPPEARARRARLVEALILEGDLRDPSVIEAMGRVPRHLFALPDQLDQAYGNHPLPIGYRQTLSQPAIVALMTEALELTGTERVLEIGTGSGYQAAILSLLAREVFSIERVPELSERARARLRALGLDNVEVRAGDGYAGWPERAPFDRILLTAAPPEIPQALLDQLAEGGVLVAPVGGGWDQQLVRARKALDRVRIEALGAVRFVPMVAGDEPVDALRVLAPTARRRPWI